MTPDQILREQLVEQLRGGRAYMSFEEASGEFPLEHINDRVPNAPYTLWAIVEHLRIAQRDILDYIAGPPTYRELRWPQEFWPPPSEEADPERWAATINAFLADRAALKKIVEDPATDLTAPLPHARQHTILREVLVAADHNAYHIGELAGLRQIMKLWPEDHE